MNTVRMGGLRAILRIVLLTTTLLAPVSVAGAQEADSSPVPTGLPPSEIDPSAPHLQTIAQGVVGLEGPVAWRVREVSLLGSTAPETGGFSFVLQRTGTELIRSELTGRRTKLEAGEAYFMATGDPFVRSAIGDAPVVAWFIEMVNPREPATLGLEGGTVLFTSQEITDYPAGSFDVELLRTVLMPEESTAVAARTGPMLLMVTSGRVQVAAGEAEAETVSAGTGQLLSGEFTVANMEPQAAVFVVAAVGDAVEGAEVPVSQAQAAAPSPVPTQAPAPAAPTPVPTQAPVPSGGDSDADNLPDDLEAQYGSDPLNPDFDGDGIADGDEVNTYGTNPTSNDSDGDGLLDGEEVFQFGTDPGSVDSDRDGLTDSEEIYNYGTGALVLDTDGDGVPDGEEILIYGTNPLDPASAP
jgi:hypothetical protein